MDKRKKTQKTIRIDNEVLEKLEKIVTVEDRSLSYIINNILRKQLELTMKY